MLLIFVVLVVLIRRGNAKDEDWDEEEFYEVSEEDEEHLIGDANDSVGLDVDVPETTVAVESSNPAPMLDDALRQELATKAGQVGVMQAALAHSRAKQDGTLMRAQNCNTGMLVLMDLGLAFNDGQWSYGC